MPPEAMWHRHEGVFPLIISPPLPSERGATWCCCRLSTPARYGMGLGGCLRQQLDELLKNTHREAA